MAKKRLKSTPGKVIDCFGKLRAGTDMAGHPKSAARLAELEKSASTKASSAYKKAEKAARADGFADPNWKEAATTAANDAAAAVVTKFRTGVLANVKALESAAKKAPKVTAPQKSVAEIKAELKQDEQWILDEIDAWLSGGREGQPADGANYSVQENVKRLKGGFDAVRAKIAGLESKTAAAEAKAEPEKPAELMSRKEWVAKNGPAPLGRAENAAWHSRLDRTIREAISQKLPVSAELAEILPFNEPIPVYGGETYLENNGYVREGDQYVYRAKESAAPEKVGSGAVARLSEGELRSMDAQSLNDYADRIEESAIEKASAAAESAQGFRFAGRWDADAVLSPTESGQVAALRDIALWKDASMKSKDGSDIAKKQMDGSISRYLDGSARTKGHENALRLTNVDQPAYSAAAVDEFRSPIANDPGFTKIGDYYIYTAGKEVPPPAEGSEGRDVATASPEPVPSGAPAKNLTQTDTKPANVKNENSAGRVGNRGRLLVFDKPIQTPAGKILSYQWQSQLIEEVDSRGEEVVRRISDWDLAEENADTGKSIVHHFLLERPDGTRSIVSLESAIGVIKGAQEGKTLKSRIAAARRLVVRQAELAQAEADLAEYERIVAQVKQEPVPQGEFVQDGNRRYSWMVDGNRVATMVLGHDAMKERMRTLDEQIQSEPRFRETEWQAYRVRQLTNIPAYKLGGRIADLKQLIKRDQQKMGGALTVAESREKEAAMESTPAPVQQNQPGPARISGIVSGDAATVSAAIRNIANDKAAPKHQRRVAADIAGVLETTPITVRFEEMDADTNGYYDPASGEVRINLNGPHELGVNETILHELAHAVTDASLVNPDTPEKKALAESVRQQFEFARKRADGLIRNKKALGAKALELSNDELLDEVRKLNDDALYDIVSGTRDLYEFAALILTSDAMQKFAGGINPNGEAKTVWDRVVDAIAKFFGKEITSAASAAYDALLKLTPQKGDVRGPMRYSMARTDIRYSKRRRAQQAGVSGVGPEYAVESRNAIRSAVIDRVFDSAKMDPASIDDYQTAYELARKVTSGNPEDLKEIQQMILGHPDMVEAGLVGDRQLDALPAEIYKELMRFAGRLAAQGGYGGRADFSLFVLMMDRYGRLMDSMPNTTDDQYTGVNRAARRLGSLAGMPFKDFIKAHFGQLAQIEDEMLKQGFTAEQLDAMRQFFEGALEPEAVDAAVAAREPEWQKPNEALTAMLAESGVPYDPNAPVQLSPKELALLPKDIQQAYKDMLAGKLGQSMDAEAAKQADELFNAREQETQRGIQQLTDTFFIGLNREENPGFIAQKTAAVNGELAGIIRETLDELGIIPNEKAFDPESVFRKILMTLGGDQLRLEKLPLLEEAIQQKIMQIFDVATLEEAMAFPKARELWSQWESVSANLMQSSTVSGSTVRRAFHQVMQQPAFDYSTQSMLAMRPEHLLVARDRIVSAVMESLRTISATAPSNIQPEMWASIEAGIVNQFNGMIAQAAEARAQANAEAAAKLGPDAETVLQAQIRRVLARHATEDTPSKTAKKKDALNELVDEHLKKADPDIESKLKALGVSDAAVSEILRAVESTRFARAELKKYKDQQRKDKAAAKALDALMEKMGPRDKSVIRANEVVGPVTIGDIAKILMEADPSKVHDMAWRRGIITAWLGNMGIMEARVKAESLDFLIASAFADAQASMVNKFVGSMKTKAPKPAPSELERIAKAIRIGFVSGAPTSWQEAFAARFKMGVPTTAEMQEMIRLENIRTDDSANQTDRVAAQGKLSALYNKFKGDPKFIIAVADHNTQSMLTGFTTQGMQFQQGILNFAFRITEEMTTGIFKKDAMANLMRAVDESFDAYVLALKSAWTNDTYRNQMQEEIQRMSSLKQLLHKEWNEYKNASKLQRMDPRRIIKLAMGTQDWARRLMSSADDAALTGIKTFVSTLEIGRLAKAKGLTVEQIKNIYDVARANVHDLLIEANARGYSHSMAKLWVRDEVEGNIRDGMIAAGVSEQDLNEIDEFSTRESEFDVGVGKLRDTGSFWDPIQVAAEWLTSFLEKATLISDEDRASGNVKVAMRSIFFRNLFGFLRTPFNMMSRQVYRSPFGLYRLAITAKGDRAKTLYARSMGTARQRQQRYRESVIWSTFQAALWTMAVMLNGEDDDPDDDILIINGQGPEDDQAAEAWRTQHQSNSIEIKVGGSKIVIPFTRIGLEGLKPGLMILGALRDAQLDGLKKNEAVALGAFALNYGVNTAYSSGTFGLKNIMDWKRTYSGKNRTIQALSYTASSLMPWSGAMRSIGKLSSPDMPDKNTVRGAIAAATPMFFIGEKSYNVYGLPIYGESAGVDGISKRLMYGFGLPIGVFQGGDDAEKAVMNWTVKTGVAPTSADRTSLDKRLLAYDKDHTPLSDEDWTKFSKMAGKTRLEGMKMALPMLDNLTDSGIKTRMKTIGDQAESAGLQAIGKSLGQ